MQKLSKTATVSDNARVKSDLNMIKAAVKNGALDSVFSLTTWKNEKSIEQRNMTITELDEHIKKIRDEKIQSIIFAEKQMNLFSQYLKRNFRQSSDDKGYSVNMILSSISRTDFIDLARLIVKTFSEIEREKSDYVDGQFNSPYTGGPQSKTECIENTAFLRLQTKARESQN